MPIVCDYIFFHFHILDNYKALDDKDSFELKLSNRFSPPKKKIKFMSIEEQWPTSPFLNHGFFSFFFWCWVHKHEKLSQPPSPPPMKCALFTFLMFDWPIIKQQPTSPHPNQVKLFFFLGVHKHEKLSKQQPIFSRPYQVAFFLFWCWVHKHEELNKPTSPPPPPTKCVLFNFIVFGSQIEEQQPTSP